MSGIKLITDKKQPWVKPKGANKDRKQPIFQYVFKYILKKWEIASSKNQVFKSGYSWQDTPF